MGVLFVDDDDAGGYAGAVKEVGRQADDALYVAAPDEIPADIGLPVAAEQHTVRQDDRSFALALKRCDEVQEEGVVTILGRGNAERKASVLIVRGIQPIGPGLGRERRIGNRKVKGLQTVFAIPSVGSGQGVAPPELGGWWPCRIMFILASAHVALSISWP